VDDEAALVAELEIAFHDHRQFGLRGSAKFIAAAASLD
jgi:hypothetical protein